MISEEKKLTKLNVGNKCTIYEVAQMHQTFEDVLQKDFVVELDVSSVEVVDASFIQLLASAHIQAANNGVELKITGQSTLLTEFTNNIYCPEVLNSDVTRAAIEAINDES